MLDKIPAAESLYNLESIDSLAESTILIHLSTRLHGPVEEVVSIKLYRCLILLSESDQVPNIRSGCFRSNISTKTEKGNCISRDSLMSPLS